ncbi:hypothetical protein SNOG_07495 [Parastagonospora nodorum SN15]|uniref:Ribosomal protein/NADH dehydrogenase domain-containing protein n=1 Tax=Phaeosphaeria nodorum (strain SN15 / ATCC MYA-4574 / FGSC 10173) TaxID=321614 RepID=Q0UL69_PHANO|nr:hypothetical protein SNOG_07495 [Parastagonospora nodorum SN15]EAT84961.2 hypothetical protein SNOG_07495 [Parastagonospora nodorum SN15]
MSSRNYNCSHIHRSHGAHNEASAKAQRGAVVLPKEVSKIGLEFNKKLYGGHLGARHFWHKILPRIKYRNPALPISIKIHNDPDGPSLLHIYTRQPAPSNPGAPPSATPNAQTTLVPDTSPPTHTLNIREKNESEILDLLLKTVQAQNAPLEPSEAELAEMRELEEQKARAERDRVQVREHFLKERREQELLKLARGEVPVAN